VTGTGTTQIFRLAIFALLVCRTEWAQAEFGHLFDRTFNSHDYQSVMWLGEGLQDQKGVMLFGNESILEYDGQSWTRVPVPNQGYIASLAADQNGTIWAGGFGAIGHLVPSGGSYLFQSDESRLPAGAKEFAEVTSVRTTGKYVYFGTINGAVLCWNGEKFVALTLPGNQGIRWTLCGRNHVFAKAPGEPLFQLAAEQLVKVTDAAEILSASTVQVLEMDRGTLLILVDRRGAYKLDESGVTAFPTEADDLFPRFPLSDAVRLEDGTLVLAFRGKGILFLDSKGHVQQAFCPENGLPNPDVQRLTLDRAGGLWVGTASDLTRIDLSAESTIFDRFNGSTFGDAYDITRFAGKLYVGTRHGIYRLDAGNRPLDIPHFSSIPGADRYFIRFALHNSGLLAGCVDGVYFFDGINCRQITECGVVETILQSQRNPDRYFVSSLKGVTAVRYQEGHWIAENRLKGFDHAVYGLAETRSGDLFISTADDFFRIHVGTDPQDPLAGASVTALSSFPGCLAPSFFSGVCSWDDQVLLFDGSGCAQFDALQNRFVEPQFIPPEFRHREFRSVSRGDAGGTHFWAVIGSDFPREKIVRFGLDDSIFALPDRVSWLLGDTGGIFEETTSDGPIVWFGGLNGVIRYRMNLPERQQSRFRVFLREAVTSGGEPVDLFNPASAVTLPFSKRDIDLRFATDRFDQLGHLTYRTRLDGTNADWSRYSSEPIWQSGSLNEGHYVLHVKARDSDGQMGDELLLSITILPPWYHTVWMYIVYAALGALAIFALIRWRLSTARAREKWLLSLVDQRTLELKELSRKAEAAKLVAETANRAKTEFLGSMSHELRTPLNSILGYARLVLRSDAATEIKRMVNSISISGEHLLEMINELLDVARLETGYMRFDLRPTELNQLFQSVAEEFRLRAVQAGLEFQLILESSTPHWVLTDPVRLKEVLHNLLGNAFKFTTSGKIQLRAGVTADRLKFDVIDTGPGISEVDLPQIFDAFYRVASSALGKEGAGLGLYIADRIVRLMGGSISVSSKLGEGTVFSIDLPAPAETASRQPDHEQVIGYRGKRLKILLVDDNDSNREVLARLLDQVGFDVLGANSAEDAFQMLTRDSVNAVISDLRMPNQTGEDLCRKIRTIPALPKTVMIASSASVSKADQELALDAGFDGFVPKPIKEHELFSVLGRELQIDWITKSPEEAGIPSEFSSPTEAAERPVTERVPPPEVQQRLRALAEQGDIVGLRREVESIGNSSSDYLIFRQRLQTLVDAFRIDQLEQILQQASTKLEKENASLKSKPER
jgi:signal transduction histidine kinase/DNA-binding NarL/FixJ family response regulator